ncbi:PREDICTED: facilitated trehalose transporter Tret1-like [Vollenhovia emeryi]|uniref:facilitated trehalose transporter Tret1-like n=1 Tax=Vollenhovia emeryi TaxID=411798 RepID=UPI0005F364E5|nr:PREDICTED: facilitated trehalose transporter Tret1-like [Vollenhovia emeryi]XP_011875715.1 PREDICTED: facilitated trehalose transporter Tret1-like [Vollenhovia emeryi]XP_011875716.1 PREDICTED: facilitated trehalose transporter Tret1-like [Vollenhovia emeryi]XP_011875717.1 PREDICTED: facilitated trehalose transporter Tret1-like [Vollenhovia emeryi]
MKYTIEKENNTKVQWTQWIAGIGVTLLLLLVGMIEIWSSPYIENLTSPESPIPMTENQASWIVSLLSVGNLIGTVCGSIAVNYLGSKTAIVVTSLTITLSWLFTLVANRREWLYAARLLGGIGMGKANSCFSLYLGEIADPTIRGALVALAVSGLSIGSLMMSIMGARLSLEMSALICLILSLLLIITFIWLPKSPDYFIKIGDDDKARASILWYHRDCDVESELTALKTFIEKNKSLPFADVLKQFKIPYIMRAQTLTSMLFVYFLFSQSIVSAYMETILQDAQVTVIDPSVIVIIVTATGLVGSLVSMYLIDKFGRRILMIVSSVGLTISLICLGVQYQLLDAGYDPTNLQALPIFAVLLYETSSCIGVIPVPSTVLSEIFLPHVKCVASCIANIVGATASIISTSTYQPLINLITQKYVFYLHALIMTTAVPYTYFRMPETKCKSLQQIQEELVGRTEQVV